MINLIDVRYEDFERRLFGRTTNTNFVADSAVLGISGAGAFFSGGAAQVMNGVTAGLTGLKSKFDQDILYSKTISVLIQQMRSDRATELNIILQRLQATANRGASVPTSTVQTQATRAATASATALLTWSPRPPNCRTRPKCNDHNRRSGCDPARGGCHLLWGLAPPRRARCLMTIFTRHTLIFMPTRVAGSPNACLSRSDGHRRQRRRCQGHGYRHQNWHTARYDTASARQMSRSEVPLEGRGDHRADTILRPLWCEALCGLVCC